MTMSIINFTWKRIIHIVISVRDSTYMIRMHSIDIMQQLITSVRSARSLAKRELSNQTIQACLNMKYTRILQSSEAIKKSVILSVINLVNSASFLYLRAVHSSLLITWMFMDSRCQLDLSLQIQTQKKRRRKRGRKKTYNLTKMRWMIRDYSLL